MTHLLTLRTSEALKLSTSIKWPPALTDTILLKARSQALKPSPHPTRCREIAVQQGSLQYVYSNLISPDKEVLGQMLCYSSEIQTYNGRMLHTKSLRVNAASWCQNG